MGECISLAQLGLWWMTSTNGAVVSTDQLSASYFWFTCFRAPLLNFLALLQRNGFKGRPSKLHARTGASDSL